MYLVVLRCVFPPPCVQRPERIGVCARVLAIFIELLGGVRIPSVLQRDSRDRRTCVSNGICVCVGHPYALGAVEAATDRIMFTSADTRSHTFRTRFIRAGKTSRDRAFIMYVPIYRANLLWQRAVVLSFILVARAPCASVPVCVCVASYGEI